MKHQKIPADRREELICAFLVKLASFVLSEYKLAVDLFEIIQALLETDKLSPNFGISTSEWTTYSSKEIFETSEKLSEFLKSTEIFKELKKYMEGCCC